MRRPPTSREARVETGDTERGATSRSVIGRRGETPCSPSSTRCTRGALHRDQLGNAGHRYGGGDVRVVSIRLWFPHATRHDPLRAVHRGGRRPRWRWISARLRLRSREEWYAYAVMALLKGAHRIAPDERHRATTICSRSSPSSPPIPLLGRRSRHVSSSTAPSHWLHRDLAVPTRATVWTGCSQRSTRSVELLAQRSCARRAPSSRSPARYPLGRRWTSSPRTRRRRAHARVARAADRACRGLARQPLRSIAFAMMTGARSCSRPAIANSVARAKVSVRRRRRRAGRPCAENDAICAAPGRVVGTPACAPSPRLRPNPCRAPWIEAT